ncbi:MAG: hypothetical protein WC621_01080 [Patescibacteria group bacterium]
MVQYENLDKNFNAFLVGIGMVSPAVLQNYFYSHNHHLKGQY